jgi:hypothetical protein
MHVGVTCCVASRNLPHFWGCCCCCCQAYEDDVCVDLVLELACGGSLLARIKRGSISEQTAARCGAITQLLAASTAHASAAA